MRKIIAIVKWHIFLGYSVVGILGMGLVIADTAQRVIAKTGWVIPLTILYPVGIIFLYLAGLAYDKSGMYLHETKYGFGQYFDKKVEKDTEK